MGVRELVMTASKVRCRRRRSASAPPAAVIVSKAVAPGNRRDNRAMFVQRLLDAVGVDERLGVDADVALPSGVERDELGRQPTHDELADELGVSTKKIQRLLKAKPAVLSESQLYTDPESGMTSLPATSEVDVIGESADVIYPGLSERDKMIYDYKTGKRGKPPLNNLQIARKLGVTPALVSQRAKDIAQRILEGQNRVL